MAKKYNTEQQQVIFNEEQNRIDAIRRTSISNNDKKAVMQIIQTEKSLREEIDATVKAASTLTKQLEDQKNKIEQQRQIANKAAKEFKANKSKESELIAKEEKQKLQSQIASFKEQEKIIKKLLEENRLRQLAKNTSLEQLDALKTEFKYAPEIIEAERQRLQIKEEQLKASERQKTLDEISLDYAKDIDRYTLKSYRDVEKQIKAKEKESELLNRKYELLSDKDKDTEYGKALKGKIDSLNKLKESLVEEQKDILGGLTSADKLQTRNSSGISDLTYEVKQGFKNSISSIDNLENSVINVINSSRNFFNGLVDGAVNTVSQYYGPIAASLDGVTGEIKDFNQLNSKLQWDIGLSSMIKQETLLGNISNLVTQGITSDIESLGVLTSIRDKTVASFDVTNSDLRRLIKLNQQKGNLTAKQFGLADALKETFNATFGDSSFINDMFQSITGTVIDAVSANANTKGTDSTSFYSVLESWLGAMYESGLSRNTIDTIARGINLVGSGNINELSGNKSLQNLMLLSMDRAGLDYADILQRGLSDSDANVLLANIVDYLAEITDSTKKNNVLQSSYANLFNMSISDMTAIQNLSKTNFSAKVLDGYNALSQTLEEVRNVSSRTSMAEQINNVIDNAKFSFGSSVADSKLAYITYKTSNLLLDSIDSMTNMALGSNTGSSSFIQKGIGKLIGGVTDKVKLVASVAYLGSMLPGVVGFGKSLLGSVDNLLGGNDALAEIISQGSSGGIFDNGTSTAGIIELPTNDEYTKRSNTLKQFSFGDSNTSSGITDTSSWENDVESSTESLDENTKILKKFEKTLMQADKSEGYAFAVSLQGMSDGVLRSFASIFADEDALMDTLTGKNNALKKNNTFIDFVEDTTKVKR